MTSTVFFKKKVRLEDFEGEKKLSNHHFSIMMSGFLFLLAIVTLPTLSTSSLLKEEMLTADVALAYMGKVVSTASGGVVFFGGISSKTAGTWKSDGIRGRLGAEAYSIENGGERGSLRGGGGESRAAWDFFSIFS